MIKADEIRNLPLRDKLQMMEVLWEGIAQRDENLEMPQWQKDLLDQRESQVARGEAGFMDWEQARQQITDATR